VRLYVVVFPEIEGLAHCANVAVCKKRANIRLKTRRFSHCASQPGDFPSRIKLPSSSSFFADHQADLVSLCLNADAIASLREPVLTDRERIAFPDASAEEPALAR
jgi:hypothetical protein